MKRFVNIFTHVTMFAFVLFAASSCLKGIGSDDNLEGNKRLVLTASKKTITANGEDTLTFSAKLGNQRLEADEFVVYDAENDQALELTEQIFTTEVVGMHRFYARCSMENSSGTMKEYVSKTIAVYAVSSGSENPENPDYLDEIVDVEPKNENGLHMTASSTIIQVGVNKSVLVIRYNGEVVKEGYTIYDSDTKEKVTFPTERYTSKGGKSYDLPVYTTKVTGTRRFWVSYKTAITSSTPVSITAVTFTVPQRATDSQPENLNFHHRSMVTQFTGTGCGYCPFMIAALETLFADEEYSKKMTWAAVHSYNTGDPMYTQESLPTFCSVQGYPTVVLDFRTSIGNYGYSSNITRIKNAVNNLMATPAKAGIAARMGMDANTLLVRMTIKANTTGEYRVGVWVIEDDLSGGTKYNQSNYGMETTTTYNGVTYKFNFNTHNRVLRRADSAQPAGKYYGYSLGTIVEGDLADRLFVIPLDDAWELNNCRLLLFVSTSDQRGFYVTNSVETQSLISPVDFEYEMVVSPVDEGQEGEAAN